MMLSAIVVALALAGAVTEQERANQAAEPPSAPVVVGKAFKAPWFVHHQPEDGRLTRLLKASHLRIDALVVINDWERGGQGTGGQVVWESNMPFVDNLSIPWLRLAIGVFGISAPATPYHASHVSDPEPMFPARYMAGGVGELVFVPRIWRVSAEVALGQQIGAGVGWAAPYAPSIFAALSWRAGLRFAVTDRVALRFGARVRFTPLQRTLAGLQRRPWSFLSEVDHSHFIADGGLVIDL